MPKPQFRYTRLTGDENMSSWPQYSDRPGPDRNAPTEGRDQSPVERNDTDTDLEAASATSSTLTATDGEADSGIPTDPAFVALSPYEKKMALVDREMDAQGMGRYQWMIFFLCGFGYFLDLMWAQAFGLILAPLQQEFGFSKIEAGNLSTSFSAGLTAGAAFWGILVDIIGRYWAFNFTVMISSVFGICLGAPNTYNAILVLVAMVGIGIGGNVPIDTTICLELLPQNRRWLLPALSVFQPIGVVICSALAYAFIPSHSCAEHLPACNQVSGGEACCTKADNYGWRYLMFTLGAITILIFVWRFFLFNFQESPRFLLYRGDDEKVVEVLQHIARYNRKECSVTMGMFAALEVDNEAASGANRNKSKLYGMKAQTKDVWHNIQHEMRRYRSFLSSPSMLWLTICVWIIYMSDYWGFTISGNFLPLILKEKGTDLGLSIEDTYRSYMYIYLFGIPGVLAGTAIYKWRRPAMFASSALFGAMLFTFTAVDSQASYIGINGLVYFFQSMFNGILYGWTPEAFPAQIRGTASGAASFFGRVSSIVAPLAAARVLARSLNGVLYLAGSGVFVSTVFILLLPARYMSNVSH